MLTQTPRKVVLINRAVPGSGKSTIAKCVLRAVRQAGHEAALHSTDEYFMSAQGTYDFDPAKLGGFHRICVEAFSSDAERGVPLLICDNTNLSPWQCEEYTTCARRHGYHVVVVGYAPRALADHVRSQQVTPQKPDAHGVPESTIREMIQEYADYKKLLDKHYVIDPRSDVRERWNDETLTVEKTDEPLKHYDADEVIELLPHEYEAAKHEMPARVLRMMGL